MDTDWIKGLKAGDEVAVWPGGYYGDPTIKTVDKVTPSGRVKIGTSAYNEYGRAMGSGRGWIGEPTVAVREKIEATHLSYNLSEVRWPTVTLECLRTCWAAVEASKAKQEAK